MDEEWNDGGEDFFDSSALQSGSPSSRKLKRALAKSNMGDLTAFDSERSAEDKALSAAEARKKIAAIVKARSQKKGPSVSIPKRGSANKGPKAKQDAKIKRKDERRDARRMVNDKVFRREKLRAERSSGSGLKDGEVSVKHQMRKGAFKRRK